MTVSERINLPAPRHAWVLLGPAIVLMGLSQGSGELWLLPKLHAKYGFDFTWIILYGSLIQLPLLVETMRTVALTGENPLVVLARHSRISALVCLALATIAMLGAAGFILTVGESLWRLVGWPSGPANTVTSKKAWALACALIFATPVLLRRRHIQKYLEIVVGACSILSLGLFLLALAARPTLVTNLPGFLAALIVPQGLGTMGTLSPADVTAVVVGFTYMGLGGWYCLFYPLWGQNRGVGASAASQVERVGDPTGARGLVLPVDDEANAGVVGKWLRQIWIATSAALAGNALTVMLTSLLAYGLLHGNSLAIGSDWDLVSRQAAFFEPTLGKLAPFVFAVAVAAFFLDTWLGTYVSLAQLISEAVPKISTRRAVAPRQLFRGVFAGLCALSLFPVVAPISPGSLLLKWMGILMFCSMPIIGSMLYFINHRLLPAAGGNVCRPSRAAGVSLIAATLVYLAGTIVYVCLVLR